MERRMVHFGDKIVGDGKPCFITFEAGPTHDGLPSAKRLASLATEAGADAVKFQIIDPERLVADREMPFSYEVLVDRDSERTETVTEPLYDILLRRTLSKDQWRELKVYCDGLGLAFFATIGFEDEVELLEDMACHSIKIASGDVNHAPLIRRAARTGMCIQLDTGNSTLDEIRAAVDVIRSQGNENIIIHQCPSGYPARLESINLNIIKTLKRMFPYPVAFSDHTPGWDMDVAAVAVGADLIEKTITLDRTTRSTEHVMSLDPPEMSRFVQTIREVEIAMGVFERIMTPEEKRNRLNVRRSIHLAEAAKSGSRMGDLAVEFRRPGTGVGPDQYDSLLDRRLRNDLEAGHRLELSDFE